uniref:Uncharacterized protein n=1 Tax=Caenorhabditis japonica TaxID=281687 RepID=A0A8R1IDU6_CAEJA
MFTEIRNSNRSQSTATTASPSASLALARPQRTIESILGHSTTASLSTSSPPLPSRSDSLVPPFLTDHAERRFLDSGARGTFWKDRTRPSTEERIKGGRNGHSRCDFLAVNFVLIICMLAAVPLPLS